MTAYQPQVGDMVRIVKCSANHPGHEGNIGKIVELDLDADGRAVVRHSGAAFDDCLADTCEPVWQVGDPVTVEPPIGSVVALYPAGGVRFTRDAEGWASNFGHTTWDYLTGKGTVYLVSLPAPPSPQDAPQVAPSDAPDSPQVREVSLADVHEGDAVTVTFTATKDDGRPGLWLSEFADGPSIFLVQKDVAVTRPVRPLPKTPGAVGTATVRGVQGVKVFRSDDDSRDVLNPAPWVSASLVNGYRWHSEGDLADFEEVDGSRPPSTPASPGNLPS